uniref:Secreted protein n=1 Tax=Tanacetum cinerariifolium TaxID=118510 RepID=A0A699GZ30_TANCI|nr:hypothetical protein [Tanacetum cinerariifolium]
MEGKFSLFGGLLRLPMVCSFVAKLKSNGVGFDRGPFFVTTLSLMPPTSSSSSFMVCGVVGRLVSLLSLSG